MAKVLVSPGVANRAKLVFADVPMEQMMQRLGHTLGNTPRRGEPAREGGIRAGETGSPQPSFLFSKRV
jgi:hypothetical protein